MRLQQQTEIEIECRRRLISSEAIVPVFNAAADALHYKNAEELISHLQSLQDEKLETMKLLNSAEEMNKDLRKQINQNQKQHSEIMLALQSQHVSATRRLQEQCSSLKQELQISVCKATKLEERQEELIRLQYGIMELWSLVTNTLEFAQLSQDLEIDNPESMICFLKDVFVQQSPVLTRKRLLDFQKLGNRVWNQHFSQDFSLKNKPLKVFEKANELMTDLKLKLETVRGVLKKTRESEKQLIGSLKEKQREFSAFQCSLDRSTKSNGLTKMRPQSAEVFLVKEELIKPQGKGTGGVQCAKPRISFTEIESLGPTLNTLASETKAKNRYSLSPKMIFQNL
eukprot:g6610.t1